MISNKVVFLNNKNKKLFGKFYKNSSDTLIIFCHGTGSFSMYENKLETFLKVYYDLGLSVFWFDFTGWGKSEGKGRFSHSQRVDDIGKAIDLFKNKYNKIVLCGISTGCIDCTIAVTKYKEITKLILVNGFYELKLTYPWLYLISLWWYLSNSETIKETFYAWKYLHSEEIKIPTLVVVGEKDKVVNPQNSFRFYEKLTCKKKLIIIPGGHDMVLKPELFQQYFSEIADWIKQ